MTHTSLGLDIRKEQYNNDALSSQLQLATATSDVRQQIKFQTLKAAATGAFDFTDFNLNRFVSMTPTPLSEWLRSAWAGHF